MTKIETDNYREEKGSTKEKNREGDGDRERAIDKKRFNEQKTGRRHKSC